MQHFSYKYKLYLAIGIFIVTCVALFSYLFKLMDNSNIALAKGTKEKYKEYQDLVAEQKNYEAGKQDIASLAKKAIQPEDFFSRDTSLVNEIKTLESTSKNFNLSLDLSVSGTADKAVKAPGAAGPIVAIPYTVSLDGQFDKTVNFMENLEHLNFITHIRSVNITAQENNGIKAVLSGNFYIKK